MQWVLLRESVGNWNEQNKYQNDKKKIVYLDLSNLYIIKIAINEYWYNYSKTIYGENAKFYNMDTDSFTLKVKSEDC